MLVFSCIFKVSIQTTELHHDILLIHTPYLLPSPGSFLYLLTQLITLAAVLLHVPSFTISISVSWTFPLITAFLVLWPTCSQIQIQTIYINTDLIDERKYLCFSTSDIFILLNKMNASFIPFPKNVMTSFFFTSYKTPLYMYTVFLFFTINICLSPHLLEWIFLHSFTFSLCMLLLKRWIALQALSNWMLHSNFLCQVTSFQ